MRGIFVESGEEMAEVAVATAEPGTVEVQVGDEGMAEDFSDELAPASEDPNAFVMNYEQREDDLYYLATNPDTGVQTATALSSILTEDFREAWQAARGSELTEFDVPQPDMNRGNEEAFVQFNLETTSVGIVQMTTQTIYRPIEREAQDEGGILEQLKPKTEQPPVSTESGETSIFKPEANIQPAKPEPKKYWWEPLQPAKDPIEQGGLLDFMEQASNSDIEPEEIKDPPFSELKPAEPKTPTEVPPPTEPVMKQDTSSTETEAPAETDEPEAEALDEDPAEPEAAELPDSSALPEAAVPKAEVPEASTPEATDPEAPDSTELPSPDDPPEPPGGVTITHVIPKTVKEPDTAQPLIEQSESATETNDETDTASKQETSKAQDTDERSLDHEQTAVYKTSEHRAEFAAGETAKASSKPESANIEHVVDARATLKDQKDPTETDNTSAAELDQATEETRIDQPLRRQERPTPARTVEATLALPTLESVDEAAEEVAAPTVRSSQNTDTPIFKAEPKQMPNEVAPAPSAQISKSDEGIEISADVDEPTETSRRATRKPTAHMTAAAAPVVPKAAKATTPTNTQIKTSEVINTPSAIILTPSTSELSPDQSLQAETIVQIDPAPKLITSAKISATPVIAQQNESAHDIVKDEVDNTATLVDTLVGLEATSEEIENNDQKLSEAPEDAAHRAKHKHTAHMTVTATPVQVHATLANQAVTEAAMPQVNTEPARIYAQIKTPEPVNAPSEITAPAKLETISEGVDTPVIAAPTRPIAADYRDRVQNETPVAAEKTDAVITPPTPDASRFVNEDPKQPVAGRKQPVATPEAQSWAEDFGATEVPIADDWYQPAVASQPAHSAESFAQPGLSAVSASTDDDITDITIDFDTDERRHATRRRTATRSTAA
jgi:hypothetical protein